MCKFTTSHLFFGNRTVSKSKPCSLTSVYPASSVCGHDEPNRALWLATWAGKMEPSLPTVSREKNFVESQIINPLLTKLFRSRWLDIGLIFFCEFMDRLGPSWNTQKKGRGQYPAILTSLSVNKWHLIHICVQQKIQQLWGGRIFILQLHRK